MFLVQTFPTFGWVVSDPQLNSYLLAGFAGDGIAPAQRERPRVPRALGFDRPSALKA